MAAARAAGKLLAVAQRLRCAAHVGCHCCLRTLTTIRSGCWAFTAKGGRARNVVAHSSAQSGAALDGCIVLEPCGAAQQHLEQMINVPARSCLLTSACGARAE